MPALMGYDATTRAAGEVGREGVSVSTLADFEVLFRDIPLDQVTTSMTINCTASVALAMYLALADKQGVAWDRLGGTLQNDILKEFIAQKEWISPPESAVRIVVDTIDFCSRHVPRFHPVSISGYHIREAGATAVQELAFTLADGFGYVQACLARGLDVTPSPPASVLLRHSQRLLRGGGQAASGPAHMGHRHARPLRRPEGGIPPLAHPHADGGVSATAQQPLNNVARVAIQALAAVLGGAQSSTPTPSTRCSPCPREEAVPVALRTQQIVAERRG